MKINLIYKLKIMKQYISRLKNNQTAQVNSLALYLSIKNTFYDSGLIIRKLSYTKDNRIMIYFHGIFIYLGILM